jgi:hypothetical protein
VASRKQDAFTRSMTALIGAAGADAFMERVDGQHELTTNLLDAQQNFIEAIEEQVKFIGEMAVELDERVERLEAALAVADSAEGD